MIKKCKYCKSDFNCRKADHDRGWALFCNKSCKAKFQTKATGIAGPDYRANKKTVHQMASGHYAKSKFHHYQTPRKLSSVITDDEYGDRKMCYCGEVATHFVNNGFGNNGWDGMCDDHIDDTHPHDFE
jgi:hypothetical protein